MIDHIEIVATFLVCRQGEGCVLVIASCIYGELAELVRCSGYALGHALSPWEVDGGVLVGKVEACTRTCQSFPEIFAPARTLHMSHAADGMPQRSQPQMEEILPREARQQTRQR